MASQSILGQAASSLTSNPKIAQLKSVTIEPTSKDALTSYFGVAQENTDISLKAGERGPALLTDSHLREKISSFDHERIPERVVHARGAAAHGNFKLHTPIPELTKAGVLTDTNRTTPIFVRFSTVTGSRGSGDSVRDPRGFAVRFFTAEGNWDIVGNNIPVFFIQDAIKFPDLIHAVKPEPHNEMPQAQSAHDNAWDFMSLHPESAHMSMWHLSDRTIPRSYRMMQGFGVHSFIFVTADGKRSFVKFHWKPHLGTHGLVWDEALKLAGQDPDYHRRDLYEAIEAGAYPKWELGVQVVPEESEHAFEFDLLDSTKIIPEDLVPVKYIGTMTLDANVTEYFAETEQVAFCTQHMVPGIDHSDDPLLAGRSFSYFDTQISRLGINFKDIPINRPQPTCPFGFNNLRDGQHKNTIHKGKVNYYPNRFDAPHPIPESEGGYVSQPTAVSGVKIRGRSEKMKELTNQATLFLNSMTTAERKSMVEAAQFELGKCEDVGVQKAQIAAWNKVDHAFAAQICEAFDFECPAEVKKNHGLRSDYLSMVDGKDNIFTVEGRKIGIYCLDGYNSASLEIVRGAILASSAMAKIVGPRSGKVTGTKDSCTTDLTFETCRSTFFDAIVVIGGEGDAYAKGLKQGRIIHAIREAYMHKKAIAVQGNAVQLLLNIALPGELPAYTSGVQTENGVVYSEDTAGPSFASAFLGEAKKHRCWARDVSAIAA